MKDFSLFLLEEGVLKFGGFTLKSGRKAPYFLNFGDIKTGRALHHLAHYYAQILIKNINTENRVLFGPAYKGIPLAVAVSIALAEKEVDIPFCYNRKEIKDHGEGGNLVGMIPKAGTNVTVIEDVMTAGTALRETMDIFKNYEGVNVDSCIISVDRMEKGKTDKCAVKEIEEEFGIDIYSISNIQEVAEELLELELIHDKMYGEIEDYLKEYGGFAD